jgi:uncharacterized protein YndB with AHSA1/START domain
MSRLAEVDLAFADHAPLRLVFHAELPHPPTRVYEALADDPSTWTWFPTLTGGRFPTEARGVGAAREVVIFGTTATETVLAADPGVRWAYRVNTLAAPLAKALVEVWDLAEQPATSTRPPTTRVTYTFALEPTSLAGRAAGTIGGGIAVAFMRAMTNLDRLLTR